ncbi:MAG: DUF4132 domain-containing protein [Oscillospiraceae bacterium]
MTEDKILEVWTNAVGYTPHHLTSAQLKEYEDFILDGKEFPENHVFQNWVYGLSEFPSNVVREMNGGENSEVARRCLWLIAKEGKHSIFGYGYLSGKSIEVCQQIGFSFAEIMEKTNCERIGYHSYVEIAETIYRVYADEITGYIDDRRLDKEERNSKKLILMLGILTQVIANDYENHKDLVALALKYFEKIPNGYALEFLCHIYNINDDTMTIFKRFASKTDYYTALNDDMTKYHGKGVFKEEMYKLGFQRNYFKAFMLNHFCLSDDNFKSGLEDLYRENRDLFADVCYEIIKNKQIFGSERAVYSVAVMLMNNDGQRELDAASEQMPHYIHILTDCFKSMNKKEKVSFIQFMQVLNSDDMSADGLELNFNYYSRCGGIENSFKILSVLAEFNKLAKKCIKLLCMCVDNKDNIHHLGSFYTAFVTTRKKWLKIPVEKSCDVFREFVPVKSFFKMHCFANSNNWLRCYTQIDKGIIEKYALENPDEALNVFSELNDISYTSAWLDFYYSLDIEKNFEPLISALRGKSKILRKKSFEIAENFEAEIRAELEKILPKLKGDAALNVTQLIRKWDNIKKFGKDFAFSSNEFTEEFCKENLNPAAVRKISWIDEGCFEGIRYADLSGTASPDILKYIISEYMLLDEPCRLISCDKVAERLNSSDLQAALENIFTLWLESGADTKQKFITLPYCLYASDSQILRLKKQLELWAKASRHQLASFVVGNMALNGGSVALLTVDGISSKFPNNAVKSAAKSAFEFAAKILEVPIDELADKIVPNFGFDKNGEKLFDYGSRTFTVSLMPDFSLSIHDNAKDKDIKSMPKPNDKDDAVKAEAAKKEFSELKKQIKAVVTSQKARLEKVFMNGRTWTAEKWKNLFEENAVMHCFAENLVWGTYENGKLKDTFRYLSDGSFCNEEDDEYELPENAEITLVHPVEMDKELLEKWNEQFEDYEIIQPFNQLNAKVTELEPNEISDNVITKYDGRSLTVGKLSSTAKKYDMQRGSAGDGGSFEGYCLEDSYIGIGMSFEADMLYFGQDFNETVNVEKIYFYRTDTGKMAAVNPNEISKRFVSSCLAIVETIVDM